MRKKLTCFLMAFILTVLAVCESIGTYHVMANDNTQVIKKGVPVLDGQVDEIYNESLILTTGIGENAYGTEWSDDYGNIYFLYSDNYLYICADIRDNSVVSAGEMYIAENTNAYKNDCCEFRLSLDGGMNTIKVGIDAYGIKAYGLKADTAKTDYSKILYETTYNGAGENSGYVIEVAVPCETEDIFDLYAAGRLGFKLQLNDLDYDGSYRYFATDYAGEGAKELVFYDLSTERVDDGTADDSNLGGTNTPATEEEPEISYKVLSLGTDTNARISVDTDITDTQNMVGNVRVESDYVSIAHGNFNGTGKAGIQYVLQSGFKTTADYDTDYKYMCVLYAADNPTGVDSVRLQYRMGAQPLTTVEFERAVVDTNGEYVFTAPVELAEEVTTRLATGGRNWLQFKTAAEGGEYRVKAFYFFRTEKDARDFTNTHIDFQKLSYAPDGNAAITETDGYGNTEMDPLQGAVKVLYDTGYKVSDKRETRYSFQSGFNTADYYKEEYQYVRVLYSAENPDNVGTTALTYRLGASPYHVVTFEDEVVNTNGAFVLTDTYNLQGVDSQGGALGNAFTNRLAIGKGNFLRFMTTAEGGEYQIKALYFFKTEEDANIFKPSLDFKEVKTIQINGNDISNYQIVVPANGFCDAMGYAERVQLQIYNISGYWLDIVDDSVEATDYELLIGDTNRAESCAYYEAGGQFHPSYHDFSVAPYFVDRVENMIVIAAAMAPALEGAAKLFNYKISGKEEVTNLTTEHIGQGMVAFDGTNWPTVTNVENPELFEDDFDTNEGYWSKDSDKPSWEITADGDNNVFTSGGNTSALSYLHIFEKNVTYEAKMKYTAETTGSMGLLLRHTADHAYIKAGYDFEAGKWFIDSREGEDFVGYRLASCDAELTAGQWYDVKVVVDGVVAELYVGDVKILSTDILTQLSAGKIGVFAENVSGYVDDVRIYFNSGLGTVMKNVVHTKLPGDVYREGGTVVEMTDGSLMYITHMSDDITFVSEDSGKTWTQRAEKWVNFATYPQVLRLNNGALMQINRETIDGVSWHRAQISNDDGVTWETAGYIRPRAYNATEATANSGVSTAGSNVNDKLTQMSDGRIFYCIGYDSSSAPMNGKSVFCEFFYSDDNGQTWTQSQTGTSFEIPGNENEAYFSECKIMETCTPGVLRMYNSWNAYGCIVYSESTDNGVTWGPIVKMEDFACCTSSMQFARDPYADNDTTYYMVWVQDDAGEVVEEKIGLPRAHLSLAKTTDGVNWEPLGDVWRWECRYKSIVQLVDPFVQVTEDYVIVGSGISEKVDSAKDTHNAQRQHIYSIDKSTLEE